MGVASALVFANLGSAYGIAKSGVGIASLGVIEPNKVFRGLIPIIMAGILGVYGVIVAVLLNNKCKDIKDAKSGYQYLGAGLSCGLSSLLLVLPLVSLVTLVSEPSPKLMVSTLV